MTTATTCARCGGPVRPPGFWSSAWQCERHGEVQPFHTATPPTLAAVELLAAESRVPVWVPRPLPAGWTVTGVARAGDERTGAVASLVAMSGPCPRGGLGDLVLVAEEPGVGVGARFAGIAGTDPGDSPDTAPDQKIEAAGHPTALWRTATGEDRLALVGESKACWLWCVIWPETAGAILDGVVLHDLRDGGHPELELVFGALTPRLA
jgi:hypothetical protein